MNSSSNGRLAGKRAIVTGAGSGIGRASALLFASEGAQVLAVDLNAEGVEETVKMIGEAGGQALAMTADASSETDVQAYVRKAIDSFGGLEVVYANAGISGGDVPLSEQTVELWEKVLRVNLVGCFLAVKHAGQHMVAQKKGSIVCTASVAGLKANAGGHPYSASKGCTELVTAAYRRSFFSTGGGAALASARAGNVIGGGDWSEDRLVPDMIRGITADQDILIRNPASTRPWQHVLEPLAGDRKSVV